MQFVISILFGKKEQYVISTRQISSVQVMCVVSRDNVRWDIHFKLSCAIVSIIAVNNAH